MCGLAGLFSSSPLQDESISQIVSALDLISNRGTQGYGILGRIFPTMGNPGYQTVSRVLESWQNRGTARPGPLSRPDLRLALVHLVSSTGSPARHPDQVHPFVLGGRFYLIHNGVVTNDRALAELWDKKKEVSIPVWVDSWAYLLGLRYWLNQGLTVPKALIATIEQISGIGACLLWDTMTETLYAWRVVSPLFLFTNNNLIGFCTAKVNEYWSGVSEGSLIQCRIPNDYPEVQYHDFSWDSPYLVSANRMKL